MSRRTIQTVGWTCLGLGLLLAAPFIFVYGFILLTLVASFPVVAMLPLDKMSDGLVQSLAMTWMFGSLITAFLLAVSPLVAFAWALKRFRHPVPGYSVGRTPEANTGPPRS